MKLHDLTPPDGSTRSKRRVGRGIAGKGGKTAGRGTKGQKARNNIPARFEGGQLTIIARTPKLRGFTNPFRVEYTPVNLDAIDALGVEDVTFEVLVERGLVKKGSLAKVLSRGELTRKVNVQAHGVSAAARAAIEAKGGSVEILDKPFAVRPAARGNQHMNR